jgi:histidinol-phosphate/aromatic aminotransferase/cobyric acid decarboxylase-like protein
MLKWKNRYNELKKPNLPSLKKIKETYNHDSLIKLNYNESNFGPSPKVLNYDYKLIKPHRYPDYHSEFLLKKLSSLYKLDQDNF